MKTEQILAEIHEANSSYLRLAKGMLLADRENARRQLGISESVALVLEKLTPDQIVRMSRSNTLLQRFDMNDDVVFGLLTQHRKPATPEADTPPAAANVVKLRT